jgi:hypothetical protein
MTRTRISSIELTALFVERLKQVSVCPDGFLIAIVPSAVDESGWSAVMNSGQRTRHPLCARRIKAIEKQLRRNYVLVED